MATHGALPKAGLVDTLEEGQRLTAVGYGATRYEISSGVRPQPVFRATATGQRLGFSTQKTPP